MTDDDADRKTRAEMRKVLHEFAESVRAEQADAAVQSIVAQFQDRLPMLYEGATLPTKEGAARHLSTACGLDNDPDLDVLLEATGYSVMVQSSGWTVFVIRCRDASGREHGVALRFRSQCQKLGRALVAIGAENWNGLPVLLADGIDGDE